MYGELSQIQALEKRMAELYPEDPKLERFASRFTSDGFDPTATRPIISPDKQMRPKAAVMESIEQAPPSDSPRPQYAREKSPRGSSFFQTLQTQVHSPKRPLPPGDESDSDVNRPRKLARGESPLKGAAGRRLEQQQKRLQQQGSGFGGGPHQQPTPASVPPMVSFLLSIMPKASQYAAQYDSKKFRSEALVNILARAQLPDPDTFDGKYHADATQRQGQPYNNGMNSNQSSSSSIRPFNSGVNGGHRNSMTPAIIPAVNPAIFGAEQAAQWLIHNNLSFAGAGLQPPRFQNINAQEIKGPQSYQKSFQRQNKK